MTKWYPIATSPRDGTHFLAWYPEGQWGPNGRVGLAMVASWSTNMLDELNLEAIGYEGGLPFDEPTLWTPFEQPSLKSMSELISEIPTEWSAFEIRSRANRTRFVCVLSKEDVEGNEVVKTGNGHTVEEAVLSAITPNPSP